MRNLVTAALVVVCCSMLFTGCGPKSDVTVLKLGHALDVTHPVHKAMAFMGEKLEEKSGGKVRIGGPVFLV